jgi:hypothetical protein
MALSDFAVIHTEPLPATSFGTTMKEMRTWLDSEKIQPLSFKTVVREAGLGFEISFRDEREADRFLRRFASLVVA